MTKPRKDGSLPQGMNWIRQEKRLAIYLRDGLACCWCGFTVEDGVRFTLDHIVPRQMGGGNDAGEPVHVLRAMQLGSEISVAFDVRRSDGDLPRWRVHGIGTDSGDSAHGGTAD
jgi:hypothetical protein